jgi:phosphoglycolate phosphatase
MNRLHCVLMDLDGTLVDTAPDLVFAANQVRRENDLPELPEAELRPLVSRGSHGLMRAAFDLARGAGDYEHNRIRLLEIYRANLSKRSRLFPSMQEVLDGLVRRGLDWGVVTNKPGWLTQPLMRELALSPPPTCIISGDSAERRKPDPDPLLMACRHSGHPPEACVYVGDSGRDMEAGRAAGMATVGAVFGYIEPGDEPAGWRADALVDHPLALLDWLDGRNG